MKRLLLAALFFITLPALAVDAPSNGEVKKIDPARGTVTLAHGPLVNLNMPAMTMAFVVTDRKTLGSLKPGDKVRFSAAEVDGKLLANGIEKIK
jgi:Cu/Ag efflux protein CusF